MAEDSPPGGDLPDDGALDRDAPDGSGGADPPGTLQDACYHRLRQWLTVGRFLPGQRLKIRAVAQALGSGTMPVRAALQRLAAEGALVNVPHAGVTVPRLSVAEFDDVLATRILLEGEAAERGALRIDAAGVSRMRALAAQMGTALAQQDGKNYLAANEEFHVTLYRCAGSPLLCALIDTVWLRVGPLSNRLFDHASACGVLNDAHEAVLVGLARRDSAAVRRSVERDLFVAGQYLRESCRAERSRRAP